MFSIDEFNWNKPEQVISLVNFSNDENSKLCFIIETNNIFDLFADAFEFLPQK